MSTPQSDNVLHAISGAGGGVLSMVLTYPLITLSTRAQVESKRAHSSVLDATRRIIAREGVAGLYAGLDSAVFGISVTNFVYYYWYEWTRRAFETAALKGGRSRAKLTTIESMIAGAVAGSATVLITNPIWVVNTRMTARKRSPSSSSKSTPSSSSSTAVSAPSVAVSAPAPAPGIPSSAAAAVPTATPTLQDPYGQRPPARTSTIGEIRALLREGGPRAFFAGVLPALILVINPILQYTIFEQLKNVLERRGRRRVRPSDAFWLGAIGKLFATAITYPYITVKSRMHVGGARDSKEESKEGEAEGKENENEEEKKKKKTPKGVWDSLTSIVRDEGWGALYAGVGPKLTQSVITAAFLFMFKDAIYKVTARAMARRRALKLKAR